MKKLTKLIATLLIAILSMSMVIACKDVTDIEIDGDGNIVGDKVSSVEFWGWGDPEEIKIFQALTNKFKSENPKINVEYIPKPSEGYDGATAQALSGRSGPDVVFVGDGSFKQWASLDLLLPLDTYLTKSTQIVQTDIWDSAMQRYRLNIDTLQSSATDTLYAVPKDIGPTVIYYNVDAFRSVGINIVSKDYSIDLDAKERVGFYYDRINASGIPEGNLTFNNRIAMTWDESEYLAKLLTISYNAASPTKFGYFTEWWFNYGWSVYGDCVKFNETTSKWEFSLGDETTKINPETGEVMPSMREAFARFVSLSMPKGTPVYTPAGKDEIKGLAITPVPDAVKTQGKTGFFTSKNVAMLVDLRAATVTIRKNADFDWDVAPLPKSAEGREAGHSGSMGIAVSKKSKVPNAAWKFCEYIAGAIGQTAMAESGFNIPNQKSIANSEVFLQSDKKPKNAKIFIDAAARQTAGDWWYFSDKLWIQEWAPSLNDDVRNAKAGKTLNWFFDTVTSKTNDALSLYTK